LTLEKEIAGLSDSLQMCEAMMNKQNSNYKSAAEQYKLCGDPTKEKVSSAVVLTRTL
jgi:hypothetical protein